MILQALTSLYEALAQKGEISKEGWSREKSASRSLLTRKAICCE